jgi:hypothetical protein
MWIRWIRIRIRNTAKNTDIQTGSQAVGTAGDSKAAGGGHCQVAIQGRQTESKVRQAACRQPAD